MTRSRGLTVWSIVAVVLVLAAWWYGEKCTPFNYDGLQLAYLALAVMIPLFVYLFSVGHMAVVGGEAAVEGETSAADVGGAQERKPAVSGMSGASDQSDD